MVTLVNRQEVFAKYPNITSEIAVIQCDFFDDDEQYFEGKQDLAAYRDMFDARHLSTHRPERWYSTLNLAYTNLSNYVSALSEKLIQLFTEIEVHGLVMLAHYKLGLVGNANNSHPPLQNALKQLVSLTGSIHYDEAMAFDVNDLPMMLNIVFWLIRCNARAPEFIYFHDQDEKLAFYLCKYGALHLVEFNSKIISADLLTRYGLQLVQGSCDDQFQESSRIEGRKSMPLL